MVYQLDPDNPGFPDPNEADDDGLIAIGGDLSFDRLVNAYAMGIFPWPVSEKEPLLWFSLDPRMVLCLDNFRCSKTLRRLLNSNRLEVKVDTCFEQVIRACSSTPRDDQDGTWITEPMIQAYIMLHKQGLAHSFETFLDGQLVGGLYGVSLGDFFSGESMFHHVTDASKVAFARLVNYCSLHHFRFIDAQQPTKHLASLGAAPMPRTLFLDQLAETPWHKTIRGQWSNHTVVLLIGGNQGDRLTLINEAINLIDQRIGHIAQQSSIYQTAPWGFEAEQDFLNMALVVDTEMDAHQVLEQALQIEAQLGRTRKDNPQGYTSRPMDIDLIFFDSAIINTPNLTIPHPHLSHRRFVMEPLAEIIPEHLHPKLNKTMIELLDECPDQGAVDLFLKAPSNSNDDADED